MSSTRRDSPTDVPEPFLKVTLFDQITSSLQTALFLLLLTVVLLFALWQFSKPPTVKNLVPIEFVELGGGQSEGSPEDALNVESSEDVIADPSLTEQPAEDIQVQEMLDQVVEYSDRATEMAEKQFQQDVTNAGPMGRVEGTGRKTGGSGNGERGIPREQRWLVRFTEDEGVDAYAAQLDYFGIELGALTRDGKMIYLSKLKDPQPVARTVTSGAGEKRLYMTWQAGDRQKADMELFARAGIKLSGATLFHFYPPQTENQLAQLEVSHANKKPDQIRRTYFVVQRERSGYKFIVTRQTYF